VPPDPNRNLFLRVIEQRLDINGRFVDMQRIDPNGGNGTFSLVFRARDRSINRIVALKFFHPDYRPDAYRWQSFKREAELLQRLIGQSDIIQSLSPMSEFIEALPLSSGGVYNLRFGYYAVELASSDVQTAIENDGWDVIQRLLAFRSMCRAVQRIHNARIVHRDLKPGNFLIMSDGSIKLADLGTAKLFDGTSPSLSTEYLPPPGDVRYTSPEIIAGLLDDDPTLAYVGDLFSLA